MKIKKLRDSGFSNATQRSRNPGSTALEKCRIILEIQEETKVSSLYERVKERRDWGWEVVNNHPLGFDFLNRHWGHGPSTTETISLTISC